MGQKWPDGYSAHVDLYLLVNGSRFPLAQVGAGSLILRQPQDIPAGTQAKLVISIDGREDIEDVVLGDGASQSQHLVPYF
jgi:hypothetical protein